MMNSGWNSGHGKCSKFDSFLHLEIDCENEKGISVLWDVYLKSKESDKSHYVN